MSEPGKGAPGVPPPQKQAGRKRRYKEEFLALGFVQAGDPSAPNPLCLLCGAKLSNNYMKSNTLRHHLTTVHPDRKDFPLEYFERKKRKRGYIAPPEPAPPTYNQKALEASFKVSNLIARTRKPYTLAKELLVPAAKIMCDIYYGEGSSDPFDSIPLSASTVTRRVQEIAEDIEAQLLDRIRESPWYAIQVDESTDVTNRSTLLVFVRYLFQEDVHEDLLCALYPPTNTTGEELFNTLDTYMKDRVDWSHCVGVCTDGAAAMTGRITGVVARIREMAPNCQAAHCVIHREVLASKKLPPELDSVLKTVVKSINHIKVHALNTRLFEQLCENMDMDYKALLLHTEVRWLSKGKALTRVYILREALHNFYKDRDPTLAACFVNREWVLKLAYLCDIFNLLNELNLSLQGKMNTVFQLEDTVSMFKAKLRSWRDALGPKSLFMFPTLMEAGGGVEFEERFLRLVDEHLMHLSDQFEYYFPASKDPRVGKEWVRDPFKNRDSDPSHLTPEEEGQLCQVSGDPEMKCLFETTSNLFTFWTKARTNYPVISNRALQLALPFATSYLCELAFSVLASIKTNTRNKLNPAHSLRISSTDIAPRWDSLMAAHRAHLSH